MVDELGNKGLFCLDDVRAKPAGHEFQIGVVTTKLTKKKAHDQAASSASSTFRTRGSSGSASA